MLGQAIMVLILLTEPNFGEAFTRLLKRCAYVIVPVSILFIKYYPEWGRGFSPWSGQGYNTGITLGKNALGWDCLILAFFYVWHLSITLRREKNKARRDELILCLGFIGMIGWLLSLADSKTPLVALCFALAVLILTGFHWVNKRLIGTYILTAAVLVVAAEMTFGIYEIALELLGRMRLSPREPISGPSCGSGGLSIPYWGQASKVSGWENGGKRSGRYWDGMRTKRTTGIWKPT
jgi:hypothetical protein